MIASFALEIVSTRTAGTCQGFAMPRPAGARLTEPVRPRKHFLIRGRRKQIEVSYNPGTVIGSGSFNGGRPAGKDLAIRDLAGLARSIQAASAVPQGRPIEDTDVRDLERRYSSVEADVTAMIGRLATGTTD